MPSFISITASDFETFGLQIGAAAESIEIISARLVANVGQDTLDFARIYPPVPHGLKQPFKTDRQRRFFFAALRAGRLQVPYQRTGTQGLRWLLRLNPAGQGLFSAEVYNDNPYRRWVQGYRREQAKIHAGRWSSQEEIEQAAEQALPRRLAEASSELERVFLLRLGR